jgi:hypothetical protein
MAQVQVPQMVIPLQGVGLQVVASPDPQAAANLVIGPMLVQFVLPLTAAGATNVATALQARAAGIVLPADG